MLTLLALAFLAMSAGFIAWALTAPEGHEDATGFHHGPAPRDRAELAALSHCLECQCFITAPCDWNHCPFRTPADVMPDRQHRAGGSGGRSVPFHDTPSSPESQRNHG